MKKHHMAHRKHKAEGGKLDAGVKAHDEAPSEVYAGAGSNVVKEAKEKKRGGRAMKHVGHVAGHKGKARADRPARKAGGRVGCEKSPFSSAHHGTEPKGHKSMPN